MNTLGYEAVNRPLLSSIKLDDYGGNFLPWLYSLQATLQTEGLKSLVTSKSSFLQVTQGTPKENVTLKEKPEPAVAPDPRNDVDFPKLEMGGGFTPMGKVYYEAALDAYKDRKQEIKNAEKALGIVSKSLGFAYQRASEPAKTAGEAIDMCHKHWQQNAVAMRQTLRTRMDNINLSESSSMEEHISKLDRLIGEFEAV
jgi:hypothetical protein